MLRFFIIIIWPCWTEMGLFQKLLSHTSSWVLFSQITILVETPSSEDVMLLPLVTACNCIYVRKVDFAGGNDDLLLHNGSLVVWDGVWSGMSAWHFFSFNNIDLWCQTSLPRFRPSGCNRRTPLTLVWLESPLDSHCMHRFHFIMDTMTSVSLKFLTSGSGTVQNNIYHQHVMSGICCHVE